MRRQDETIRLFQNYRRLNALTKEVSFPLPKTTDVLDMMIMHQPSWFTLIDMWSSFSQIKMHQYSIDKTSFVTPRGSYKCTVMPPGLTGSPATLQRLITGVLEGLLFENVLTYIDEILIFGKSYSEHLQDIEKVFNRLRDANLKLHPPRCVDELYKK